MPNDPIDRVAVLRNGDANITAEWPAERRAAVLAAVLDDSQPLRMTPVARPRRRFLAPVAASIAVVAVAGVSAVVLANGDSHGPAPAGVRPTAASGPLTPHQYAYSVSSSYVLRHSTFVRVERDRNWVAPSGRTYSARQGQQNGCWNFAPPQEPAFAAPNQRWLASLPTAVSTLERYMRAHVSGSTSGDEAVFVAVGDTLRVTSGLVLPELRAAFLGVLERTAHVRVHRSARTPDGRQAIRVDFVDPRHRPNQIQSIYLDPDDAAMIAEASGTHAPADRSYTVTSAPKVVDTIPASMLACRKSS